MKRHLKGLVQRGVGQSTQRPNDPIEKIMLSAAGLTRQPTDARVDEITSEVTTSLKPLLEIAMSGNVHAIRRVAEVASNLASEATMLACMHQDAANQVARERTTWPLNIPNDPQERRRALRLVTGARKLPLGEKAHPSRPSTRASSFSSPATAAVLVAMKAIQIERSFRVPSELFPVLQPEWSVAAAALPELDASSAVTEQWSTVIWKYICHRHGGAPETSALKRLVEHESDASRHAPANEHAARNRIRQALHDAFVRLLRKKTPRTR